MKLLGTVILTFAAFSVTADQQLELDVHFYLNDQLIESKLVQTESDKSLSIVARNEITFNVTPTLKNDSVNLGFTLQPIERNVFFDNLNAKEPNLITKLNEKAVIEIGDTGGANSKLYRIEITAKKI